MTLAEWATLLRANAVRAPALIATTLETEMRILGAQAASMPGAYTGWPPLAQSTLDEKSRLGYRIPAPLYRTGHLQGSIKGEAAGYVGVIGSDDPVAVYHEFGTSKMPPRPIYALVMQTNLVRLAEVFGVLTVRMLSTPRI